MLHFVNEHFGDLMVATATLILAWTTRHLWTAQESAKVAQTLKPWKHISRHTESDGHAGTESSDTTWDAEDTPPTR